MSVLRFPIYWLMSLAAGGIVAGFARFDGYSGHYEGFFNAFLLYSFPLPMALGMFHIPAIAVGSIVCASFMTSKGRLITYLCGALFLVGLLIHLALKMVTGDGQWTVFAFATVDLLVLFGVGAVVAD